MNFERGKDPKEAMSIGREAILKEIGGIIVRRGESHKLPTDIIHEKNVIIQISDDGEYQILKNRYGDCHQGNEKDLIKELLKIREQFKKWSDPFLEFPTMQKVSARTIGQDLVSVQPMSAPKSGTFYVDLKYKKPSIFKRIFRTKPHKKPNI